MNFVVIEDFVDLEDGRYRYRAGDAFPRSGLRVTRERLTELSTNANKQRRPLIREVIPPVIEETEESAANEPVDVPKAQPKSRRKRKTNA